MVETISGNHGQDTVKTVSPYREMIAYEALWGNEKATFKRLSDLFKKNPESLPSELIDESQIEKYKKLLFELFDTKKTNRFGIRINGLADYPPTLRQAVNPVEVIYFRGNWDLAYSKSIAIVGSRKPSEDGKNRAHKLATILVKNGFTIASGLAEGIDTAAHWGAIQSKGNTIAVIGTPLNEVYPKVNHGLQELIAKKHLLISQVPFYRYSIQDYRSNRNFFPERNKTMSAISKATIIVEASDTSGTLIQARAAIAQQRKLFILESCFQNKDITWPERFEKKGAIRVRTEEDILDNLN